MKVEIIKSTQSKNKYSHFLFQVCWWEFARLPLDVQHPSPAGVDCHMQNLVKSNPTPKIVKIIPKWKTTKKNTRVSKCCRDLRMILSFLQTKSISNKHLKASLCNRHSFYDFLEQFFCVLTPPTHKAQKFIPIFIARQLLTEIDREATLSKALRTPDHVTADVTGLSLSQSIIGGDQWRLMIYMDFVAGMSMQHWLVELWKPMITERTILSSKNS